MRNFIGIIFGLLLATTASAADFTLRSSVVANNGALGELYTCNGKNISPPLSWENAPSNTQSFALLMYSPDWPEEMVYKWIVFNIPSTMTKLAEGDSTSLPAGVVTAMNSFGDSIYRGPCAPDNKSHHYVFDIYALDTTLDLDDSASLDDIMTAIKHHAIKDAKLTITYQH